MIASLTVGPAPIPTLFPITATVRELDPAAWPAPYLIERYRRELAVLDAARAVRST